MRKISAKWVLKFLNADQKRIRVMTWLHLYDSQTYHEDSEKLAQDVWILKKKDTTEFGTTARETINKMI
ncbi:Hypothetical predicted protein [Octopus vulgaris]|uniref:Uncharacterized protein n=1 Tax=Octopus vulgaris TaxID=6645 RepID=A0AA36F1Q6_OCTVU|nr:Hypothetical predicted protein [Octopus vulgaris]